jgi:hypothetical protein
MAEGPGLTKSIAKVKPTGGGAKAGHTGDTDDVGCYSLEA